MLRAKPRAWRVPSRGVEGVETRMVGREAELLALQVAYREVIGAGGTVAGANELAAGRRSNLAFVPVAG